MRGIRTLPRDPTPMPERRIVARVNELYLDQEARVVRTDRTYAVPLLDAQLPSLRDGETIHGAGIKTAIAILDDLHNRQLAVNTMRIYNDHYMELYLAAGVTVIVNSSVDSYYFGSALQSMFAVFTVEHAFPAVIDFRFEKPVLRQD